MAATVANPTQRASALSSSRWDAGEATTLHVERMNRLPAAPARTHGAVKSVAGPNAVLRTAGAEAVLNSVNSGLRRDGNRRREKPCSAGLRLQCRAPRPCVVVQPYRPPSRDRPTTTGSSKKDALRRCITTMGHRHVRLRRELIKYAQFRATQVFLCPRSDFFAGAARRS